MRELNNQLSRHLDLEEMQAIIEAGKILEKTFRKKVYRINIKKNEALPTDVYGIDFTLELNPIKS